LVNNPTAKARGYPSLDSDVEEENNLVCIDYYLGKVKAEKLKLEGTRSELSRSPEQWGAMFDSQQDDMQRAIDASSDTGGGLSQLSAICGKATEIAATCVAFLECLEKQVLMGVGVK